MAGLATMTAVVAGLWVLSPIDLIPGFLSVIGPLDDVVVVALALRYAARRVPPVVPFEAWPADPRLWPIQMWRMDDPGSAPFCRRTPHGRGHPS